MGKEVKVRTPEEIRRLVLEADEVKDIMA